ncbi:MAG: peptidylprolyl isomerase [Elusimicrobiota bacterium]
MAILKRSVLLTVFVLPLFLTTLSAEVVSKVVARVNNEVILQSELEKNMSPLIDMLLPKNQQTKENESKLRDNVLDQMINLRLVQQEAKKRGIKISKPEVDRGMETVKNRFPTEADFSNELKRNGYTLTAFREKIEQQLMMMKILEIEVQSKIVKPTEDDAKTLYNKIQKVVSAGGKAESGTELEKKELEQLAAEFALASAEQVRLRHILFEVKPTATDEENEKIKQKAEDVKKQIDNGGDIRELAKKYSDDTDSKNKGGDLGYVPKRNLPELKDFEGAAFSLPVGGISGVVKTNFGYHILKVEEKKAAQKLAFDDIKNYLMVYIAQKRVDENSAIWVEALRKKAAIKKY